MTKENFFYALLDLIATDEITATEVSDFLKHPNQQARRVEDILADLTWVATDDNVFLVNGVITVQSAHSKYVNKIQEQINELTAQILKSQEEMSKPLFSTEYHAGDALRYLQGATIKPRQGLQSSDFLNFNASCCGQPSYVYFNNIWSCTTCGHIDKKRSEIADAIRKENPYGIPPFSPKCECGAGFTSNPNCHSFWCPRYGR